MTDVEGVYKPQKPAAKVDWHRLFGLLPMDYFTGSLVEAETELDLSVQKQFLDVVIIRRGEGTRKDPLTDGLDDLNEDNLVKFESHCEALEDFHLKE